MFEHLYGWEDINPILELLNDHGILFLFTLICEEVPQDPDWFYIRPSHVTYWTNAAMSRLFDRWGYVGCAYHEEAKLWMFFKDKAQYQELQAKKDMIDGTFVFSDHFVDYWKQPPYRPTDKRK